MYKILLSISSILISFSTIAQIGPVFSFKKFLSTNEPFIETYIEVYSNTLEIREFDSTHISYGIEVTQVVKNTKEEIIDFKKYTIEEKTKPNEVLNNILDLQRFSLANGNYLLEIQVTDIYNSASTETFTSKLRIDFSNKELEISDIELLESFGETSEINNTTKSGFSLIPLVSNYYSPEFNKLAYYFEIYNPLLNPEESYVLLQSIKIKETGEIAGQFNKLKKVKLIEINPIINSFNIENLPTGNYELVIQVRNQLNELITEKKIDFQRTNFNTPMDIDRLNSVTIANTFSSELDKDSLTEFINCLSPIASPFELNIINRKLKQMDDTLKRQFIYSFWFNKDNANPRKSWEDYKIQVNRIEQLFGTRIKRGYQTDRGRVYLKYGAPNNLIDRPNEPSSYPYQIWHYYRLGKFNNKRFIFYLPDLVTNDYTILHSDVPGEVKNENWNTTLNSRNSTNGNLGEPNSGNTDHWGSNSSTLFKNP
jgi:GWxTD domain-containing protein